MKRRQFLAYSGVFSLVVTTGGLRIINASEAETDEFASPDMVLSINESGQVVFTSPYTEMGQGSPTAAAMIIADELDVDLDGVEIRQHDGRIVQTDPTFEDRFNGGGSGGSQSMATAWPALREIGASARTTLIEVAALRWGVPAEQCDTQPGKVVHTPSGRSVPYAELVSGAANQPAPKQLRYRNPEDYHYVGKPRSRPDTKEIITGRAPYAMDKRLPGMLYASIERCPFVQGKPVSYDRDAALAVDGVVEVFFINPSEFEPRAKCSIAVVANNTWSALQGRKALNPQWEDQQTAWADEAAFWAAMQEGLESAAPNGEHTVGDFEQVDTTSLRSISASYRLGYQNQTPMEPIALTAWHQGDRIEVWVGTQYPSDYRDRIAEITGLDQDHITLNNTIMGGSFGRRFVLDGVTEAILIADKLRQPVKLVWTREDDLQNGQYRNAGLMKMEAHVDEQAQIQRWYQKAVQTSPRDPEKVASLEHGMSDQPYRIEPARYEMSGIKGNVNLGPMRSPPHPAKMMPTICFIDELAHAMGKDPIDLHIELIGAPRVLPQAEWLQDHGHEDNTATHIEVALAVRRLSDWDKPLPEGHGKGFSLGYIFGTHVGMVVEVSWHDEAITIENVWCAVNCGRVINPDIARQQVEGGAIYGLSSAMGEVITTVNGAVQQSNFDTYPLMRYAQAPNIVVEFMPSDQRPSGLGEPATPPAYPALANAIFAATGQRIREVPLNRHIRFAPMRSYS